ncbi:hypothetical protein HYT58_03105 [Candidatus Woesearchaeota archaeon]|nr:hypothetical protein [Candidatus Woesearchaeota archaeon]
MRIALVIKGTEEILSEDLNGKKILPGRIEFQDSDNLQGVNATYSLIKRFKFKSLEDIRNQISQLDFNIKEPFRVVCNRKGTHSFKSITAEQEIGEVIFNKGFKVDLKQPKTTVFLDIINNECLIGYLEKNKNESLLDPFCRDSTIPIEAHFYGIKEIYAFDIIKNNIYNSSINIKLAKAQINLKHYKVPELNSLIKKVDYIITSPPYPSNNMQTKQLTPILKEFFIQSSKILKKSMVVITPKPDLTLDLSKDLFKIENSFTASIGQNNYTILKMSPR